MDELSVAFEGHHRVDGSGTNGREEATVGALRDREVVHRREDGLASMERRKLHSSGGTGGVGDLRACREAAQATRCCNGGNDDAPRLLAEDLDDGAGVEPNPSSPNVD